MGACCTNSTATLKIPDHDVIAKAGGESPGMNMEVDCGQLITRNFDKIQKTYKIGRVLGLGSFGEVREIKHREDDDDYVVKMMTKRLMTAKLQKRIHYEIGLQKKLNHPNIVKIKEWYENDQRFYIIQEHLAGGELYTRMRKRKHKGFTEEEAASIIQQALMAINYLHKNKIVHRDVKPENLIFQNENENDLRLKLVDFGTAQKFNPGQFMLQQFGTPYYMAPEVIKGCYNEKCDVWSIGVILYILLTGEIPFDGETEAEILTKISQFKTFMF